MNNHVNGQNDVPMDGVPAETSKSLKPKHFFRENLNFFSELNQQLLSTKTQKDLKSGASLVVKILRAFVLSNNFKAAEDFVQSVKTLPDSATNNDWARW